MDKMINRIRSNQKGFTLVELLIVMVILGILIAIAVPAFNTARTNAAKKTDLSNLQTIAQAINQAAADNDLILENGTTTLGATSLPATKNGAASTELTSALVLTYLKGNKWPSHPAGGNYSNVGITIVGEGITLTDATSALLGTVSYTE